MPLLPAILLVDDDATTNFINQRLLRRLQVTEEVQVALNGEEALARLQSCGLESDPCPALILLDVNMPVMNGFEFLEAFADLPPNQRGAIIIVMLTTTQLNQDLARIQHLPVADFLPKPLTREAVLDVLQRHFNLSVPD